jgi:hypothetical protein
VLVLVLVLSGAGDRGTGHRQYRVRRHAREARSRQALAPAAGAAPRRGGRGRGGACPRRQVIDEEGALLALGPPVVAGVNHEEGLAAARGRFRLARQLVLDAAVDVERLGVVLVHGGRRREDCRAGGGSEADRRQGGEGRRRSRCRRRGPDDPEDGLAPAQLELAVVADESRGLAAGHQDLTYLPLVAGCGHLCQLLLSSSRAPLGLPLAPVLTPAS